MQLPIMGLIKRHKILLFQVLLFLLLGLQIQDGICTYIGVSNHGLWIEQNPIIYRLMENFGIEIGLFVPKMISSLLILLMFNFLNDIYSSSMVLLLLIFTDLFYLWAAYHWLSFLLL